MIPISLSPIAWAAVAAGVLAGGYFIVDAIGDKREAKVHARYAKAADMTNKDIAAFNSDDEKVTAVAEALRVKALEAARSVPSKHMATKEQAAALSAIRWP